LPLYLQSGSADMLLLQKLYQYVVLDVGLKNIRYYEVNRSLNAIQNGKLKT
jgi:hypothetical protein